MPSHPFPSPLLSRVVVFIVVHSAGGSVSLSPQPFGGGARLFVAGSVNGAGRMRRLAANSQVNNLSLAHSSVRPSRPVGWPGTHGCRGQRSSLCFA